MSSYRDRIKEQIKQYAREVNIHELPDIFHYWSNKYLRPRFESVLGANDLYSFYGNAIDAALGRKEGSSRILSVGSGDASNEIEIARKLIAMGARDFEFVCLELSPILLERSQEAIDAAGLGERFSLVECDINSWKPSQTYAAVMAHHSLHHVVELESLFDGIARSLTPNGVFITCDMIGRNGHMRWPEALNAVQHVWSTMPDQYKYNHQLKRLELVFDNWDCSAEGFEGIRAQDILGLAMERFAFERFLAYGNMIDIFGGRGFGHNYSAESEAHCRFIDHVHALDDLLISRGIIKPTQMGAIMRKSWQREPIVYRDWTPEHCWRDPNAHVELLPILDWHYRWEDGE